jgi:hypothetical protein
VDFVEITPETLCREEWHGSTSALILMPEAVERAKATCGSLPIVVHGVELSIGSAANWNDAYLDMLDRFQEAWPFLWHSEHLSFQTVPGQDGRSLEVGVPLPLPPTEESARLVAGRSANIGHRYGVPFLLENPAHYLTDLPRDSSIGDEIGLMARIIELGHCGQLLDLHNLYCNAINLGFDAVAAIDRMKLDRVIEIHVAGGRWLEEYWTDAHDGRVPEPVWELLRYALSRCPNLAGVVFEILDSPALQLGATAIARELERAHAIWQDCRCAAGASTG